MIKRLENRLLLTPNDLTPSAREFRVIGVFNPGAVRYRNKVILLIRVAEKPEEKRKGTVPYPRFKKYKNQTRITVDHLASYIDPNIKDHRVYRLKNGLSRLPHISYLKKVALSPEGLTVVDIDYKHPIYGSEPWDEYGIEDPRITQFGRSYFITYVSISHRMGVATSLMKTSNFKTYTRLGIIFPQENKDVVLFPQKIKGYYAALHRPRGLFEFREPAIQCAYSKDRIHWGGHQFVLEPGPPPNAWDYLRVGAGPPPIRTSKGWLCIYHGVRKKHKDDVIGAYSVGAFLTSLQNPCRILARSPKPFMSATEPFEMQGYVSQVVFPTGTVIDKKDPDKILIYYGCADSCIAVVKYSLKDILNSLKRVKS